MVLFKPQKAKTYGKDKIKDLSGEWYLSKKYDGHQIFIVKQGELVEFFTSQWKQFNIETLREPLSKLQEDFVLIGEYLYDCDGKLGSRAKSSKLTTFRTNFSKSLLNETQDEEKSKVIVFDCIPMKCHYAKTKAYDSYLYFWKSMIMRRSYLESLCLPEDIQLVDIQKVEIFIDSSGRLYNPAIKIVDDWMHNGWEGGMLIRTNSPYNPGKRVHHAIKLKSRHTADLLCTDITYGEGKYKGLIGSLELKDSKGCTVNVGSGLTDSDRVKPSCLFIDKVVEIEYERIDDTYIQPVFKCIREDKTEKYID